MKSNDKHSLKDNPDWAFHCLNYDDLKRMLHDGIAKAPKQITSSEVHDGQVNYMQYVTLFDERFFKCCDQELDKINKFCREKVHECINSFLELKADAEVIALANRDERRGRRHKDFWRPRGSKVSEETLDQGFKKCYTQLHLLSIYQEVNYNGFKKILGKHDKQFNNSSGDFMLKSKVEVSYFHLVKDVKRLMQETEMIVAVVFEEGSRPRAIKRLAIPQQDNSVGPWTGFKLGLMAGTCIVLLAVLAVSGIADPSRPVWRLVIRFYRGPMLIIIYLFLIGINIYAWTTRGINHVYIFNLDPADHMIHHQFWNIAAVMGVLWAISIVIFINSKNIGLPVFVSPFVLLVLQLSFLFNPFPFGFFSARKWLLKIMVRLVTAPFHRVSFADFWMCDQLSSLISLVLDYIFTMCFFMQVDTFKAMEFRDSRICCLPTATKCPCKCDSPDYYWRAMIRCIPAFLRVCQCLRRFHDNPLPCPHLVNALKYLLSLTSTILSALHAHKVRVINNEKGMLFLWVAVSIVSSLMSYSWDIKMDWGLSNVRSRNRFLRNEMLYPHIWFYYASIIGDFFLRFSWAVSLSLTDMRFVQSDIMLTFTAPMEIFRRFVWNMFRLENEQINNNNAQMAALGGSHVSVSSFHLTDEQQMTDLLHIMDNPDGAVKKQAERIAKAGGSFTSFDFYKNSKSELFTRVGSNSEIDLDSLSQLSSIINMRETQPGLLWRLRQVFCSCFQSKKFKFSH